MLKAVNVLLSFFYLWLSIGISGEIHYCGGEPSEIAFYNGNAQCICDSNPKKRILRKGCCDDADFSYQLRTDQNNTPTTSFSFLSPVVIAKSIVQVKPEHATINKDNAGLIAFDLPPPKIPEYKKNCSFIFYG